MNPTIKEQFNQKRLTYLFENQFSNPKLKQKCWKKSKATQQDKSHFDNLTLEYENHLQSPPPSFFIKESDGCGLGLFTEESIPTNKIIGQYTGKIEKALRKWSFKNLFNRKTIQTDYCWTYPEPLTFFTPLQINAERAGNELRFVNHSFSPNLEPQPLLYKGQWIVLFVTLRLISPNEELTIDYGDDYWNHPSRQLYLPKHQLTQQTIKKEQP